MDFYSRWEMVTMRVSYYRSPLNPPVTTRMLVVTWMIWNVFWIQCSEADELFRIPCCGDAIVVPVTVADEKFAFDIDTASGISVVDKRLLRLVGKQTRFVQTFDGAEFHRTTLYSAPNIAIGGFTPAVDEVILHDLQRLRNGIGHDFSGTIGVDVLKQAAFSIDFDAGELRIHGSQFQVSDKESTRKRCAVTTDPNTIVIYNSIPGSVTADSQPFVVDSGLAASLALSEENFDGLVAEKIITNVRKSKGSSAFNPRELVVGNIRNFRFAGHVHPSLKCVRMKLNLIGRRLLARYRVTFDLPNEQIWFRPGKRINERDPVVNSGIGVEYDAMRRVLITEVDKSSVAEAAAIRIDDQLLEIDGQPVVKFSLFQIRERFAMPGDFRMKILRAGKFLMLEFQLEKGAQ